MKITRKQLKKIIEEELKEAWAGDKGESELPSPSKSGFTPPTSWKNKPLAHEVTATQVLTPDELPSAEEPSKGSLSDRLTKLEARFQEFMDVFFAWQAKQNLAMSEEKER